MKNMGKIVLMIPSLISGVRFLFLEQLIREAQWSQIFHHFSINFMMINEA